MVEQQNRLPIEDALPALKEALQAGSGAVLVAEPGAGKTTRVPLALLDEPWLRGQRIVMLEPRRLAARSAARYMARAMGEKPGETVGYRVRLDTKVSAATRVEVITEGVLTRMLQEDPALEGVGLLIFDEFHERHLHADLGLALALESQALLRGDLRILVMSATLEAEPVAALLGGVPVIHSPGRTYPVDTHYAPQPESVPLERAVARTIAAALQRHDGDLMAFLPGAGEIRRTEEALYAEMRSHGMDGRVRIAPLFGQLSAEAQDAAIAPGTDGRRKVVLATALAETSLTVEGVRIVVDSGLMRVPRFSPRTGMTRLETLPVSRASADQRRGRAGRLGPGVCYRLWPEARHAQLPAQTTPEILDADLAPLVLELAAWGTAAADLRWLTPPPAAALAQGADLLQRIGALTPAGTLTAHGRELAGNGLHPRLAHMIVRAEPLGLCAAACDLAALLGERDLFRKDPGAAETPLSPDLSLRLAALAARRAPQAASAAGGRLDEGAVRQVREQAQRYRQAFGAFDDAQPPSAAEAGLLAAFAYPDRIAERRADGRYLLANGRGAAFAPAVARSAPLAREPYLVALQLDDTGADSRILLAAALDRALLERHFAEQLVRETQVAWDAAAQAVRARARVRLGALTLADAQHPAPDAEAVQRALLQGIAREGLALLPWTKQARQWQTRLQFMHRHQPDWPDAGEEALLATLEEWLGPHVYGMRSRADLQSLNLAAALEALLPWEKRQQIEREAPTHMTVPSGSRIAIDYTDPDRPVLAVRLQEVFGWQETPRIANGAVPLTLHLLSPAQRPVQVTQDLASFWQNTYFEVKKDLKGRYPKHYWPDDPHEAIATRRTRPQPPRG
ncbi:ATP-dependent helicase HrpB [Paenibacillus thiaminolyticus]|uniref:ATP-dependent helicase HrpB n=1 Tax=Paenibacillus thiaminolyticus TaxID=49283 RepID=UPI0011635A85|nr:ATP-dependent helicase HrpB [Paenibacillus thiaminolyticus]NGP60286.1 ATP-dependent helicase HrpB [Paenibacillus thiaminolyticus]